MPSGTLATPNTTIESDAYNAFANDIASEMTGSLPTSGVKAMAANLAMGSNRITGLANATALTDAVSLGQAYPPVDEKTADYTVLVADRGKMIPVDASGAARTVTLLSAASAGEGYRLAVKKSDSSVNTVTLAPDGSQTIDGESSYVLTQEGETALLRSDGTNWQVEASHSQPASITAFNLMAASQGFSLVNGTLSFSNDGTALTIAIKTLAGNDPSTADPVLILFRSATLAAGGYQMASLVAAASVTIPSGATMGFSNSTPGRLWMGGLLDGSTFRLAVSNRRTSTGIASLNEAALHTTTEIGSGADSAGVLYSDTAVSEGAPLAILGYIEYTSGLAAAGTWNANPDVAVLCSARTPLPGQTTGNIQQAVKTNVQDIGTTSTSGEAIIGLSVTISMASAANATRVKAQICHGNSASSDALAVSFRITHEGSAVVTGNASGARIQATMGSGGSGSGGGTMHVAAFDNLYFPEASGDQDFAAEAISATVTVKINQSSTDTNNNNYHRAVSTLSVEEIMG